MNKREWIVSVASLFVAALFVLIALMVYIASPGIAMAFVAGVLVLSAMLLVTQAGKPARAALAKQASRRNRR